MRPDFWIVTISARDTQIRCLQAFPVSFIPGRRLARRWQELRSLSNSVKITYFDRAAVERALDGWVSALTQQHPEVARVVLFGSVARHRALPGSDVDVMLVLSDSDRMFRERPALYEPDAFPTGIDIFAYTSDELDRMLAEGNWFVKRALREGIILFDRDAMA